MTLVVIAEELPHETVYQFLVRNHVVLQALLF